MRDTGGRGNGMMRAGADGNGGDGGAGSRAPDDGAARGGPSAPVAAAGPAAGEGRPARLAVVVSHPIQYFVPLYRALAGDDGLELRVLFAAHIGQRAMLDPGMGVAVQWAGDLTAGYDHAFLPGAERIERVGLRAVDNPGVGRALAAFRPDAVLIHGYATLTCLKALAWCRLRGTPALMIADASAEIRPGGVAGALRRLAKRLVVRQFAAILTLGDRSEGYFRGLGYPAGRLFRTPAMPDPGFWQARAERTALRERMRAQLGLQADDFVLLSSAKLVPGKRVGDILAAMAALPADAAPCRAGGRRVVLLVAGDGELRAALEAQAAAAGIRAVFHGFVNLDRLPALCTAADVLVHSSGFDAYGMVLLEAAVIGLPLLASDRVGAVGPASIARPGVNTLVFPCGDVAALAAAIARLRDDPALCARFSAASLALSQDHAGPRSVAGVRAALAACGALSARRTR